MLSLEKCNKLLDTYDKNIIFIEHMLLVQSCKDYEAWNDKQTYCPIRYNKIQLELEEEKIIKVKNYIKKHYERI